MSFRLRCPNCGLRNQSEFAFRGELKRRPQPDALWEAWVDYVYLKENKRGRQLEWWVHRSGCRRWFVVARDTTRNTDHESFWFSDLQD